MGCPDGASWTKNSGWGTADLCDSAWYGVTCEAGNVTTLILSDNLLSGPIPAVLGNLSNLGWLSLNNNQLSGPIPAVLGNLSDLWNLDLNYNQLSGPISVALFW